ncbi:hypothetical protein BDV19DRAFT_384699 [Aspergillus venezuelensis]
MATFDWHAKRTDLSGIVLLDRAPESEGIDLSSVRLYRLSRVRTQMAEHGIDALILSDPVNIRYATGARNMQVYTMRAAPSRYLLLTATRSILFEFTGCLHLGQGYETVDEVRVAKSALCVESYIGEENGGEGVKLEQQVLVTETGVRVLSEFPFEESFLVE